LAVGRPMMVFDPTINRTGGFVPPADRIEQPQFIHVRLVPIRKECQPSSIGRPTRQTIGLWTLCEDSHFTRVEIDQYDTSRRSSLQNLAHDRGAGGPTCVRRSANIGKLYGDAFARPVPRLGSRREISKDGSVAYIWLHKSGSMVW